MDQPISKRQRRLLTNAFTRDKWRILRNPRLWTAAHLELLIARINELAESDPQESLELGIEVLPPIFDRASHDLPPDTVALGYAALGQASRRLGRLAEADGFYERAWKLRDLERSTWTRLHWQRAVLALDYRDFSRALKLADQAVGLARGPVEEAEALIVRGIIDVAREAFHSAGEVLRRALSVSPPDSELQFIALGNLAELTLRSGSQSELSTTGACVASLRDQLRGRRTRQGRKLIAHLNWTEGKILIKLGISGRIVMRRLRQAALALVRLSFIGDALLCTSDLLSYAQEHNQTSKVLGICNEVLDLASDLGADSHFETRFILEEIVANHGMDKALVEAFHQALRSAA